ncbi:hypothetical protein HG535_0G01660 [Zygotorulaspora mrakii]|uniref:Uncharacterized protein n=1 Tax=Zygotorulaspora mrakii TaxID=42260 RepID=A0A7H9B956_ZYGMR|nr:uncharacterized protein HG535_0G01660 [Zygotorulaspora mrakii]QLG74282.1 hypothetical protein HG535_0G01660 [Zygotorulaspora mrakii]
MGGKVLMTVSTPCNAKGRVSGYRIVQYSDRRLSILPREMNTNNSKTDIDTNVQAFCYLTPKDGVIAAAAGDEIMDTSDYMILAKSNGFIEIIKDYHYKVEKNMALNPSYILKCTPEDFSNIGSDFMFAGIQYKDGFLYCCLCSGRIFIFLLNLPSGYIQADNSFVKLLGSPDILNLYSDITSGLTRGVESPEETNLFFEMRFTGRSKLRHICYYLLPMEPEHLRTCPSLFLNNAYKNNIIYKPSIYVSLDEDISDFRINPFDRLSFFTISPGSPLIIRKVMLPMAYVNFFAKFITIKRRILERNHGEVNSWNQVAKSFDYDSFRAYLTDDTQDNIQFDSTTFDQIATFDNISLLRTIIVWIQRTDHSKDDISRLFGQAETTHNRRHQILGRSPSFRRTSRYTLQTVGLRETVDLPSSDDWEIAPLIREIRRNTFTVDFNIVQLKPLSHTNDERSASREEDNTRTSFLTDNYKNMDIICIDRYLSLSIFRPANLDVALTRIESFHDYETSSYSSSAIFEEEREFKIALNGLTSFKKLFTITDSLFMILDTNGVVLLDRQHLSDSKNLAKNPKCAVRVAPFSIGLISDGIMIVRKLENSSLNDGYNVVFDLIVTCIPGEILAFEGRFTSNSKIGSLTLCDSLRLRKKNKFVDKLCLLSYEPSIDERKRLHDMNEAHPSVPKRRKWNLQIE